MNMIKKWTGVITIGVAMSFLFVACSDFENREFSIDKPQSLIDQEARDAYKELKTYVNYSDQPNFKLGVELNLDDVTNNSPLYRLMQGHFDELNFTRLNHMDFVADNTPVMTSFSSALEANMTAAMPVHAGHLVWHEKQRDTYMRGLIADVILPGQAGSDVVVNFDNSAIGTAYPTTNSGASAKIVADPDGKSGNALRVVKTTGTAFPQIAVTLPGGRTLGQYKSVAIDFKAGGSFGLYGAGMRLAITTAPGDPTLTGFGGPSSFGVADNVWGRGTIVLPLANLNLTDEQKALTTFLVTIGSQTGSADYLLDNLTFKWETVGRTIVKTPEEKKTIITAELDKWIKAIAGAGKDKVKSWSVIYQPMDETDPSKLRSGPATGTPAANTFYWQDYLGKDYAAVAIGMVKKYANAGDKIYFTETNLVDNPGKIQGLKDFIAYTEGKNAHVDGIATELALNVGSDKAKVESMLKGLASTGKLIKISALDIGTGGATAQATAALYQEQAEMYKWFVKVYNSSIPAAQRAGITFRSPHDRASGDSWRASEPVGLWTRFTSGSTVNAGYQRKPAYVGVLEAFQGK